jgi:hypothetical protein
MRWAARVLGSLIGLYFLVIGLASALFDPEPLSLEGAFLAGLAIVAVAGVVIAWWRERIGGWILVIDGFALGVFTYVTAGRNKIPVALLMGGPLLVAGVLFLMSWRRSRTT